MATIRPFQGIRYSEEAVGDLKKVVTPPYDVISEDEQNKYYEMSEYNIIRLILGKQYPDDTEDNNRYTRAAQDYRNWLSHGILKKDEARCIYLYNQKFTLSNGEEYERKGFISLLKLEEFDKGMVKPHEKTLHGPKLDRLQLMHACNTNFSQVFGIYDGAGTQIADVLKPVFQRTPDVEVIDNTGIVNQVWVLSDAEIIEKVEKGMEDRFVFIADGHHRYETALNYRNEIREKVKVYTGDEAFNYVMAMFVDMREPGLVILPTHRIVTDMVITDEELLLKVQESFDIVRYRINNESEKDTAKNRLFEDLNKCYQNRTSGFGFYSGNNAFYLLRLKDHSILKNIMSEEDYSIYGDIDVAIFQKLLLENTLGIELEQIASGGKITYVKEINDAIDKVDNLRNAAAFLLNPTPIDQVIKVASRGKVMPQKSTFFYPKLLTGLVINDLS
jgi:uncharacterized protein (DUF1015 family)